jgi:hypothetical protein
LHRGKTKLGNPKYFFALRDEGDLVEVIPAGYEVYENPNAQVFLRRTQSQVITDMVSRWGGPGFAAGISIEWLNG